MKTLLSLPVLPALLVLGTALAPMSAEAQVPRTVVTELLAATW